MFRLFFVPFLAIITLSSFAQQTATIYGNVSDDDGLGLPNANIYVVDRNIYAQTDNKGNYSIAVPANDTIILRFTYSGYDTIFRKEYLQPDERYVLVVKLKGLTLGPVVIKNKETMKHIPLDKLESIPYTMDPLTAILQALNAVINNELTSQYSIRGGNYDENLVYVNDFEIYRPLLVRSGQQEGLPFPNYDLIDNIAFSAGGFEAKYGDKLSSVLDIQYKRPKEFEAGVTASLLGASFYMNDNIDSGKAYYLFGTR
ncbi:MAG: carboxypeptidase-like regulatory domain-containing protein, partial [Chitinophagales bacterium]